MKINRFFKTLLNLKNILFILLGLLLVANLFLTKRVDDLQSFLVYAQGCKEEGSCTTDSECCSDQCEKYPGDPTGDCLPAEAPSGPGVGEPECPPGSGQGCQRDYPNVSACDATCGEPTDAPCPSPWQCICPPGSNCEGEDADFQRCRNVDCPEESDCECGGGPSQPKESTCDFLRVFDQDDNQIEPANMQAGVLYTLATNGNDADGGRFRITSDGSVGSWNLSDDQNSSGDYIFYYTFAEDIDYTVHSEIRAYDNWWPGSACVISFASGTPPTPELACLDLVRNPGDQLGIGDSVVFTCSHRVENLTFDHYDYRFNINGGDWQTPSSWQNLTGNTPAYTISQEGIYVVQCRVCVSEDSSRCTDWGQAGGWTP